MSSFICKLLTTLCSLINDNKNKALIDIRLRPSIATLLAAVIATWSLHASPYSPLRPNVTSSIQLKLHNVSQRRQKRTKPRPQKIYTTNFVKIG